MAVYTEINIYDDFLNNKIPLFKQIERTIRAQGELSQNNIIDSMLASNGS